MIPIPPSQGIYPRFQEPDDYEEPDCPCCGGDGLVELEDHPEMWADDCLMEANRLVTCPECSGLPTSTEPHAARGSEVKP